MTEIPTKMHAVYAQDWYEFDPGYWNPLPEWYTVYHISIEALGRLHQASSQPESNSSDQCLKRRLAGNMAEVDEGIRHQEVKTRQTMIIRGGQARIVP